MKSRKAPAVIALAYIVSISTTGAMAQQYAPGTHVMTSPTSHEWVGATVVKFDPATNSCIVHFDEPFHYTNEMRVSLDNVRPGGVSPTAPPLQVTGATTALPQQATGNANNGAGGIAPGGGNPTAAAVQTPNVPQANGMIPPGSHVQVSPSGSDWVFGTVVKFDRGSYVINFDRPYYGNASERVSSYRVLPPGAAPPAQDNSVARGNPDYNPFNPTNAPIPTKDDNSGQAPAGSLGAQFQETIRQTYVGDAPPNEPITVAFQSWSMTGPMPLGTADPNASPGMFIALANKPPNAYRIQTTFTITNHYKTGARRINTIKGMYVGYTDPNGQLQCGSILGPSSHGMQYAPAP